MMSLPTRRRSTVEAVDDAQLMAELEPTAVQLYERHMSTAKEWFPHEMVPWSRGRDYTADEVWDPDTMKLCDSTGLPGPCASVIAAVVPPGGSGTGSAFTGLVVPVCSANVPSLPS